MSGSRTPAFLPCKWATCKNFFFSTKEALLGHLETHFIEPQTKIRLSTTTPRPPHPPHSNRRTADQLDLSDNERPHKQPKVLNSNNNPKPIPQTTTSPQPPARTTSEQSPPKTSPSKTPKRSPLNSSPSLSDKDASPTTSTSSPKSTGRTSAPNSGRSPLNRVFTSDTLSRALGSPTPTRPPKDRTRSSDAPLKSPSSMQVLPFPKTHLANAQVRYPPATISPSDSTRTGRKSTPDVRYPSSTSKNPDPANTESRYRSSKPQNSTHSRSKSTTNAETRYSPSTPRNSDPTRSGSKSTTNAGTRYPPSTSRSPNSSHGRSMSTANEETRYPPSTAKNPDTAHSCSTESTRYPPSTPKNLDPARSGPKSATNAEMRYPPSTPQNPDPTDEPVTNAETRYPPSTSKNPDPTHKAATNAETSTTKNSAPTQKLTTNTDASYSGSTSNRTDPTHGSATLSEPTNSGLGILFTPQTLSQIRNHEQSQKSSTRPPSIPFASVSSQHRTPQEDRARSNSKPPGSQQHQERRQEKSSTLPTQENVAENSSEKAVQQLAQQNSDSQQQGNQPSVVSNAPKEPDVARNHQDATNVNPNPERTAQGGAAQQSPKPPQDKAIIPPARPPILRPSPSTSSNQPDAAQTPMQMQQLHLTLLYQKQFEEELMKEKMAKQMQIAHLQRQMEQQSQHFQQKTTAPHSTNHIQAQQNTYMQNIRHSVPQQPPQPSPTQSQVNLAINSQTSSNTQDPTIFFAPNSTSGNGTKASSSDACDICHGQADSKVIVCDRCLSPYHMNCHKPAPPEKLCVHEVWLCMNCSQ